MPARRPKLANTLRERAAEMGHLSPRERAIAFILQYPNWTNREIEYEISVSRMTVARARREIADRLGAHLVSSDNFDEAAGLNVRAPAPTFGMWNVSLDRDGLLEWARAMRDRWSEAVHRLEREVVARATVDP